MGLTGSQQHDSLHNAAGNDVVEMLKWLVEDQNFRVHDLRIICACERLQYQNKGIYSFIFGLEFGKIY